MKTITFNLELLSEIAATRDAATEGAHAGLDYLPGSLFLGWVAAQKYAEWKNEFHEGTSWAWLAFHSGKVRFGAATPEGGFPIPFSWHGRKGTDFHSQGFLHREALADLSRLNWEDWEKRTDPPSVSLERSRQPVQLRSGWFTTNTAARHEPEQRLRLKTAIDRDGFGRAAKSQIFGYSALCQGQLFGGSIKCDDCVPVGLVAELKTLFATGRELRLGRSRSAEYGAARITTQTYFGDENPVLCCEPGATVTLFAASDLCLSDASGQLTCNLAEALNGTLLAGSGLDRKHSHVRTRGYAAWNAFHQSPGPFRLLVEKGSVFVVKLADEKPLALPSELWLGQHRNEGLGRLLINPIFLTENWKPEVSPRDEDEPALPMSEYPPFATVQAIPFVPLLMARHHASALDALAREQGLKWAKDWGKWHGISRSQWGRVREAAARNTRRAQLVIELRAVFTHGLTSKKWKSPGNTDNSPAIKILQALGLDKHQFDETMDYKANPTPSPITFLASSPVISSDVAAALTAAGLDPIKDLDTFLVRALHHAAASVSRFHSQNL